MTYASATKVPVAKTKTAIDDMLKKAKATATAVFEEERRAAVAFQMNGRRIMFHLPLDPKDTEQRRRTRWRALLLCMKAKLESVASGVETFEEAFLAHVMMPDGQTVGEHTAPMIAKSYESGTMQPLLPAPKR